MTSAATVSPSLRDIAWAAGFLEGEGNVVTPRPGTSIAIRAVQVQREPLERLLKFFGGAIYGPRQYGTNKQPHFDWVASGKRARGLIYTLYSFMSPRRQEQMRTALANCTVRKVATDHACKHGHAWTEDNTYIVKYSGGKFGQQCRTCSRLSQARSKARNKEKEAA